MTKTIIISIIKVIIILSFTINIYLLNNHLLLFYNLLILIEINFNSIMVYKLKEMVKGMFYCCNLITIDAITNLPTHRQIFWFRTEKEMFSPHFYKSF